MAKIRTRVKKPGEQVPAQRPGGSVYDPVNMPNQYDQAIGPDRRTSVEELDMETLEPLLKRPK